MSEEKDFFEKFGLEVSKGSVEIGETYPIYGSITNFLKEDDACIEVEVNFHMRIILNLPDENRDDRLALLKERAFEPGIFVTEIIDNDLDHEKYSVLGRCNTVVYGRKQVTETT